MKKKLIILFLLGFAFAVIIIFREIIFQDSYGRLKVSSSPTSSVFLDNLTIGKVPFEQKIKEGEYLLKLIPESPATDTATWQGKIRIHKNSLTFVERELGSTDINSAGVVLTIMKTDSAAPNTGEIEVIADPAGSIVYLDNDEKGITPLKISGIVKGEHELSVYSPGFFRRTQKINVESSYKDIAEFKLAVDPSHKRVEDIKKEKKASDSAVLKKTFVVVRETETGFLRVRSEPSLSASEAAQVKPKDKFELLEESSGWYKISYEQDKVGWVYGQYAQKVEE